MPEVLVLFGLGNPAFEGSIGTCNESVSKAEAKDENAGDYSGPRDSWGKRVGFLQVW